AGSASFQTMFSVADHRRGRFFSLLMPFNKGPRHCGQFSAAGPATAAHSRSVASPSRFNIGLSPNDLPKHRIATSVKLLLLEPLSRVHSFASFDTRQPRCHEGHEANSIFYAGMERAIPPAARPAATRVGPRESQRSRIADRR